jgi:hypothetical protein
MELQHRHYVRIARIIADLPLQLRIPVSAHFAHALKGSNPKYSFDRFYRAANGDPINGRDRARPSSLGYVIDNRPLEDRA